MNSVIDKALKTPRPRYLAKIANIVFAIAIAVTAILALAGIRSNWID